MPNTHICTCARHAPDQDDGPCIACGGTLNGGAGASDNDIQAEVIPVFVMYIGRNAGGAQTLKAVFTDRLAAHEWCNDMNLKEPNSQGRRLFYVGKDVFSHVPLNPPPPALG